MADYAHNYTDKQLEVLEKRFQSVYRQAEKEVTEKLEDYLKKFEAKDKAKQKLLAEGKISEEDYKKWRYGQMMTGKRWKEMRDRLAQDYTNANQNAIDAMNRRLPDVFAENTNYSTYEIENGLHLDTSFTMYDRQTVDRLLRDNPELLPQPSVDIPKDLRWNRQKIQGAIEQGILQGESIPKIAKRLQKVTDMNKSAATRNARTAMTGAQNGGRIESYKRARDLGIDMRQCWLATMDGRVRHSHAVMDGETQEVGKEFSNGCAYPGDPNGPPEEIYNCFVEDTEIASDSEIIRSYKHVYYGDLINIKTAGGVDFTCTPNHPILSDSGWISAARLNKGDNLVVASVGNIHMSRRNPDINHVHTRMDAFHEFFNEIFGHRACNLGVNFHGDIPATDVEIVTKEGLLRICYNSAIFKRVNELVLKSANAFYFGNSNLMKHFWRVFSSTSSLVRLVRNTLSFFWRRLLHSNKHSLRPISRSDSCVSQYTINDLTTKSEAVSEALTRFPGQISVDKVVDVKIIPSRSSGIHVYNLQTNNGYYFVNSSIAQNAQKCNGNFAIAHNCRCTLIAQLKGFEHDVSQGRFSKLDDMSYDEWKEYHRSKIKQSNNQQHYYKEVKISGIDEPQMREINEIFKSLDKKYGAILQDVIDDLQYDQIVYDELFENAVNDRIQRFPKKRRKTIEKEVREMMGERPTEYDVTKGGEYNSTRGIISLNPHGGFTNSIEENAEKRRNRIERWERKGRKSYNVFYTVGDSVVSNFTHEYGHAIDYTYGVSKDKRFLDFYKGLEKDGITRGLSEYASANENEFIAEAFAESFFPDTQGEISKGFMKVLEEIVNGKR